MSVKSNNKNNFYEIFRKFVVEYLLKLIGESSINEEDIISNNNGEENFKYVSYNQKDKILSLGINDMKLMEVKLHYEISDDDLRLIRNILPKFYKIAKYNLNGKSNNRYISKTNERINYEYALQAGICNWIVGDSDKYSKLENLLNILEKWSMKTYEGKNVSYGIVVNLENKDEDLNNEFGTFLDFLQDEFSAVLTDSITSVFEINTNCKLLGYKTIIDENCTGKVDGYDLKNNIPFRFANVITKLVDDKKIGIFLLGNGDIILSKNQQIKFVKRNMKWLNFNIKSFRNAIKEFVDENNVNDTLLQEIYSTALDVSFAHTGGIISLITNNKIVDANNDLDIVNKCDFISSNHTDDEIKKYLSDKNSKLDNTLRICKKELQAEIKKRILKRSMIRLMLNGNYQFTKISRKLRSELVSLDGACIIGLKGDVYSFGAIIQNDSGSSGGGRGAAAKKLSAYGMAIKISTDGYIEVYLNQQKIYTIK